MPGTNNLNLKLTFDKKQVDTYTAKPIKFNISLYNSEIVDPLISFYYIDSSKIINFFNDTGFGTDKDLIEFINDGTFLASCPTKTHGNNPIFIPQTFNVSKNFCLDKLVTLFVLAKYESNNGTSLYWGWTDSSLTIDYENNVDIDLKRKDIPVKVSFYKADNTNTSYETMNNDYYTTISTYTGKEAVLSSLQDKIQSVCPERYTISLQKPSKVLFEKDYVEVIIYFDYSYEYDVSDSNFDSIFETDVAEITDNAFIVLKGNLTSDSPSTEERFKNILQNLSTITTELTLDMSGLSGVSEIPEDSYIYAQKLKSISLPNSLTKLKKDSFTDGTNTCSQLTSVQIPSTIMDIEGGVFNGCSSLEQVTFKGEPVSGAKTYRIEDGSLIEYYQPDPNIPETKTLLWTKYDASRTSINFAEEYPGVTKIAGYVFENWIKLNSIDITDITDIGESAFEGCSISQLTIDGSFTLGENAFANALDTLILDIEVSATNVDTIKTNYIEPTIGTKHLIFNKTAVLPDDATGWVICQSSGKPNIPVNNLVSANTALLYSYRENIQSIEFKGANSSIGARQFVNYNILSKIITNGNVVSFGDFACFGCDNLTSIDLQGVTYVGACAFESCSKLSTIELGNTIKQIGQRAFYQTKIQGKTITIPLSTFAIGADSFYVQNGTKPTIVITHAQDPDEETWYKRAWPQTTNDPWFNYVMKPSPQTDIAVNFFTKIEGEELDNLDSMIQTSVTSVTDTSNLSNNADCYLRVINPGN